MIIEIEISFYLYYIQNKRFGLNLDHSQCDCKNEFGERTHSDYRNKGIQYISQAFKCKLK